MKLFIVACLKDNEVDVQQIFKKANINVFSSTDVKGFKQNDSVNILENWFASEEETFDSMFVLSFTASENTEKGLELIKAYNNKNDSQFPIRAFVVPVEKSI